jgi:hypothetical protein
VLEVHDLEDDAVDLDMGAVLELVSGNRGNQPLCSEIVVCSMQTPSQIWARYELSLFAIASRAPWGRVAYMR